MEQQLEDKVALVTGAAGGMGAAVARAVSKLGADVALNDLTVDSVLPLRDSLDTRTLAVAADVTNKAEVESMVASVEHQLGPIDILVNNAGGASTHKDCRHR
jgi:2,3-dihydro-2,3-dihydroxybenzoate dehydrogenase